MLGLNQNDQDKVWKLKQEKTLEIISKSTKQDNEKIILLEYLKKQNIKIGCVTNSIKITASKMLEVSNLLPYIDLLVTNENVENNKPFPDCYNYAVHKLCVSPDMVMCVEDSNTGIKAAKNSVCKYLWIVKDPTEVTLNNYNLRVNSL
jgi:HAD superfamily hydrolase (TIGR01509 family)